MRFRPGKILATVFKPFVWLLYWVTFKRVDFRHCAACKARAKYLDEMFGK